MFYRGVSWNQIQKNIHSPLVNLIKQSLQILIGSIAWCCCVIIGHVITSITKWRFKTWVHPNRIASQLLDIVQMLNDSLKITDSICIGILKRLWINLIENCIFQPLCHTSSLLTVIQSILYFKSISVFILLRCTRSVNFLFHFLTS